MCSEGFVESSTQPASQKQTLGAVYIAVAKKICGKLWYIYIAGAHLSMK